MVNYYGLDLVQRIELYLRRISMYVKVLPCHATPPALLTLQILPVSLAFFADRNRNLSPALASRENPPVSFNLQPMSIHEIYDR